MKERENELTLRPYLTNLETGEIFMPEGQEGPKPDKSQIRKSERMTPEDTVGRLRKLQAEEMIKKGITFPPGWEDADLEAKNAFVLEMSARAAAKETTFTRDGDQSVTITEKPTRKPRAPRRVKQTEEQVSQPILQHAEVSITQQIKDAIDAVKRGEVPINPATGEPLIALTQEHAIKAPEQQLKEIESSSSQQEAKSGQGGRRESPPSSPPPEQREFASEPQMPEGYFVWTSLGAKEAVLPTNATEEQISVAQHFLQERGGEEWRTRQEESMARYRAFGETSAEELKDQNRIEIKTLNDRIGTSLEELTQLREQLAGELTDEERQAKENRSQTLEGILGDTFDRYMQFARLAGSEIDANESKQDEKDKSYLRNMIQLQEAIGNHNWEEAKNLSGTTLPRVNFFFERLERVPDLPRSFEDLVRLIMSASSEEWRTGEKALMDKEGNVNRKNFLGWVRNRMLALHEFNPNSEVDFFQQINVRSTWSNISFYDMIFTGSYFLEKTEKQVPVGIMDENGKIATQPKEGYHRNIDLEKLRDQLINEVFLFQTSRNFHVKYTQVMGFESEVPKILGQIYLTNIFTRSNFMEEIFNMPAISNKTEAERLNTDADKEVQTMLETNGKVGEATRRLLLSYYYIFDKEMLDNILGEDAVLFQKDYKVFDSTTGKQKKDKEGNLRTDLSRGRKSGGSPYDPEDWFDQNGILKTGDQDMMKEFMEYINIFTGPGPNKDAKIIAEVRERMALSIMDKMNINYDEAKLAEAWAFSMTRWSGLAAKNDTDAVGHDAWTKPLNLFEYRLRQIAEHRNAAVGNLFNLLGLKRIGLNFWEGIRDTQGRSILEAVQGGQGSEYVPDLDFKSLRNAGKGMDFNENAMALFNSNHIGNSFQFLEFIMDNHKFNFQELITYDHGRPIIDYEKANKVIDGMQKAIRYMYSTWGGTDYSKVVRTWEKKEVDGDIVLTPVDLPLVAQLFSSEILQSLIDETHRAEQRKDTDEEKLKKRLTKKDPDSWTRHEERRIKRERLQNARAYLRSTPDEKRRYDAMNDAEKEQYLLSNEKQFKDFVDQKANTKTEANSWDIRGLNEVLDTTKIQEHDVRAYLWKSVMKYMVVSEIEAHRNPYSDQQIFNLARMEAIYNYLKIQRVFTPEEINDIRRDPHTRTRFWTDMGSIEVGQALMAGGGMEIIRRIIAEMQKGLR